jgi:hypothetical protein
LTEFRSARGSGVAHGGERKIAVIASGETAMRYHTCRSAVLSVALAVLAACASGSAVQQRHEAARARYLAYAGPPIDQFTWLGRYDGWQALSRDELVVFTNVNDAYYLKVWPSCQDLTFVSERIGLTSTMNTVYKNTDSVKTGKWSCPITEIRKIDYRRLKEDARQASADAKAAQSQPASAQPPQQ